MDPMAIFAEAEQLLSLEPGCVVAAREPGRARVLEQRLGIACPPSIREWYEREDATRLLATYSNADHPLDVATMERIGDQVVFLIENQGVCRWAFRLDDADDPEVVVQEEHGPWRSCHCGFAGFVAAQIFDWAEGWSKDSRMLWSDEVAPSTRAWLAERFRPGPVARQRVVPTHRFFDGSFRISIVDDVWKVKSKAFGDTDRLLEALAPFFAEET
jgi:hypothetical protein